MKKLFPILLCAMLIATCTLAYAEAFGLQDDDGFIPVTDDLESIEIQINGSTTSLTFDSSEEYSTVLDGMVQASFYAYSGDAEYLYELYISFPDSVQSGTAVTAEYALQNDAPMSSVVMIISNRETEQYYYAGQTNGDIYPSGSSYSIDFDTVSEAGSVRTYEGRLTASLVEMDANNATPVSSFTIENAPFTFTMPTESLRREDDINPFDELPPAPDDPVAPAATIPPTTPTDAVRV